MPTLKQIYDARFEFTDLRKKVIAAVGKAAFDVMNEPGTTPNHTLRLKWAKQALKNVNQAVDDILWYVALSDIAESPATAQDSEIIATVNSLLVIASNVAS